MLERRLGFVAVAGEVSDLRRPASGLSFYPEGWPGPVARSNSSGCGNAWQAGPLAPGRGQAGWGPWPVARFEAVVTKTPGGNLTKWDPFGTVPKKPGTRGNSGGL